MKMLVKCPECKEYWPDPEITNRCTCQGEEFVIQMPRFMCPACHMEYHALQVLQTNEC